MGKYMTNDGDSHDKKAKGLAQWLTLVIPSTQDAVARESQD